MNHPGEPSTLVFSTFVAMVPVAKGRARVTRTGHAFTPAKTRHAEERIQYQYQSEYRKAPHEGAVSVYITFHMPRPASKSKKILFPVSRPDIDNLAKSALDPGNQIIWKDDSQICLLTLSKVYTTTTPGFQIEVHSLGEEPHA